MLGGFLVGLSTAWFLTIFGVDTMIIDVIQPMTETAITASHYYVVFGLIGLVGGAFSRN